MNSDNKNFLIPPKCDANGILRISEELVNALGNKGITHGRARTSDDETLPVVLDMSTRTISGLKSWLKKHDEDDRSSILIEIETTNPLSFNISFSLEKLPQNDSTSPTLQPPSEGLYLGRELKGTFNELVPTNDAFSLPESDLLTHAFICGVTGTGKTVLGKVFLEEAARKNIPSIAIDLKGDISSLALIMDGDDPEMFVPWTRATKTQSIEEKAAEEAAEHKKKLISWGMQGDVFHQMKNKVAVNIFTPRSNDGFRLALSAFPKPPDDIEEIKENDPDGYDSLIDFLADQCVARLETNKILAQKAKGYVFEIIKTCFNKGYSMHGYEGLKRVLDEVRSPEMGIDQIGGLPTNDYISEKDRANLANALNALLTGAGKRLYEGWPISINKLVDESLVGGKTPVTILNLSHLEFRDQAYVVGYVAYLIWFWMRRREGTYDPKLLFYIDEIGGGGGKTAFFPSTAISPSKPALNLLLRQGRAKGVCCIFATQNPGDIDYKGLSNCGIWAVGKLRTKRDRSKIEQGASDAEIEFDSAKRFLPNLGTGQFLIQSPSTPWSMLEERWLTGIHRPLSSEELKKIKSSYENDAKLLLEKAEECYAENDLKNSENLLKEVISNHPFSALAARAQLRLARVYIETNRHADAQNVLEEVLCRWVQSDDRAEASFLLGRCHEHASNFDRAHASYAEAEMATTDPNLKQQSAAHSDYCKARELWPNLGLIGKLVWWMQGRKPEDGALLQLQKVDEKILAEVHNSNLAGYDLNVPPDLDYESLLRASRETESTSSELNAEIVKAIEWSKRQVPKLQALRIDNKVLEARELAERIIQRLTTPQTAFPEEVLTELAILEEVVGEKRKNIQSRITNIEARQFEYEVARLFSLMGYMVHVTQATADDGVDVFATKDKEKVVIQCKRWRNKAVGRAAIDELAGTAQRHQATKTILATTSHFSPDAQRVAREHEIDLWDFDTLTRYFREYAQN